MIDGRVAFCGGFDLSKWRWDTSEHLAEDTRRVDTEGTPYPPFHDVEMLVDQEAARTLETLCLSRWARATGEELAAAAPLESDPWPEGVIALLQDHDCAIARTFPAYEDQREVREIEQLYLDMIAAAERFIHIENQYLTSSAVCEALKSDYADALAPRWSSCCHRRPAVGWSSTPWTS